MYTPDGPDTFWLNFTNIALGLVTLICVAVIGTAAFRELAQRLALKKKLVDDHAFHTPELGVTMADGGERVDHEK
jgi:hypothetical protein